MSMPKNNPPIYPNWGLWEVEQIQAKYISPTWVQFSCRRLVVNGEREIRNVMYTIFDRIRGVDFDEKVRDELQAFIRKMQVRNKRILELREKDLI
jgi:hypothetical protein